MNAATRNAVSALGAGLAVGITADLLLPAEPWGLNLFVCVVALVAAGVWVSRRSGLTPSPDAGWLALTALLLGAAFVRRDAESLQVLDVLALVGVFGLAAPAAAGLSLRDLRVGRYLVAVVISARNTLFGVVLALMELDWRELPLANRGGRARGIALGVIIAAPLLLLFGALFASADPVFSRAVNGVFAFDLGEAMGHVVRTGVLGAFAAGYLRGVMVHRPLPAFPVRDVPSGGNAVPVITALVLLNALFLLFVAVQLRYFFGGSARVQEIVGLTYAQYARRGFFELVAASALVLPVLLAAEWAARGAAVAALRRFRLAAVGLLGLLAVIVASALERMRLYVQAYGLTEDRLYATAVMIGLVIVLVWLGWTVLRGRGERFAFGAVIQALTVLAGLHVLNPDAFIARHNLARPASESAVDVAYVATLSADAAPALARALPGLPADVVCDAAPAFQRWSRPAEDWRSWNWARARARQISRQAAVQAAIAHCSPGATP